MYKNRLSNRKNLPILTDLPRGDESDISNYSSDDEKLEKNVFSSQDESNSDSSLDSETEETNKRVISKKLFKPKKNAPKANPKKLNMYSKAKKSEETHFVDSTFKRGKTRFFNLYDKIRRPN